MTPFFQYLVIFSITLYVYILARNHTNNGNVLNFSGLLQPSALWHLYPVSVVAMFIYFNINALQPTDWNLIAAVNIAYMLGYSHGVSAKK